MDEYKDLLKEYRSCKRRSMKEYRVSRPSDISGGRGSARSLAKSDFRSLMKNIKNRISQGEKRQLVVKDELIKYWKKNSSKTVDQLSKKFKTSTLVTTETDDTQEVEDGNRSGTEF